MKKPSLKIGVWFRKALAKKQNPGFINHCKIMKNKHTRRQRVGLKISTVLPFLVKVRKAKAPIPLNTDFILPLQVLKVLQLLYFFNTTCYAT
jgi:hypothetical protein